MSAPMTSAVSADEPTGAAASRPVLLRMTGIGKSFPGVRALEDVSVTVHEGEVAALLGENGARLPTPPRSSSTVSRSTRRRRSARRR